MPFSVSETTFQEAFELLRCLRDGDNESFILNKTLVPLVEEQILTFSPEDVKIGYEPGEVWPDKVGYVVYIYLCEEKMELVEYVCDTLLKNHEKKDLVYFHAMKYILDFRPHWDESINNLLFFLERTKFDNEKGRENYIELLYEVVMEGNLGITELLLQFIPRGVSKEEIEELAEELVGRKARDMYNLISEYV